MDPLTIGIGAIGLGMKLFGGFGAASAQSQISGYQQQEAQSEMQVEQQKQQAFVLQTNRARMENFRNVQQAKATAMSRGTSQNAQFGSGVAGGQAQISDQGGVNDLGLTQNLQISKNIFASDQSINADKIAISGLQSTAATDTAIAGFGGTLMSGAGTMSNIFGAAGAGYNNWAANNAGSFGSNYYGPKAPQ